MLATLLTILVTYLLVLPPLLVVGHCLITGVWDKRPKR